jgi:hypothetical protein
MCKIIKNKSYNRKDSVGRFSNPTPNAAENNIRIKNKKISNRKIGRKN